MKDLIYLSRAYVEFGPFSSAEIAGFQKRGLLRDSDYLRAEGTEAWLHVNEWTPPVVATPKPAVKKAAATKTKTAAPKAATAKPVTARKAKKAA